MIEPVSDLRLQKFGSIAEIARRFPTEFSADLKLRESRDCSLSPEAPQRANSRDEYKADAETGLVGWRPSADRTGLRPEIPANRKYCWEFSLFQRRRGR